MTTTTATHTPNSHTLPSMSTVDEPLVDETAPAPGPEGGRLVAFVGLCGGAGTTTIAYLTALAAARQYGPKRVLVCDTGPVSGALALYAGQHSQWNLPQVAHRLATGLPLEGELFATLPGGLRLLASGPGHPPTVESAPFMRVLADARAAHALTIVDCGTLQRAVDRQVLEVADHTCWVLPASGEALPRAWALLTAVASREWSRETLVARAAVGERKASVRTLRELAGERGAPLVLVPTVPDPTGTGLEAAIEAAQVSTAALLGVYTR